MMDPGGAPFAIGIGHFKACNDRGGPLQGGNALRGFAGTLRSAPQYAGRDRAEV